MAQGNSGQWETVGGKASKIKPKKTEDKSKKGSNGDKDKKAPILKIDELVATQTRYDILDPEQKELARQQKEKEKEKEKAKLKENEAKKKSDKTSSKPKETKEPKSLDEAIKELRIEQVKNVLDNVTAKFKDSPLVWLKDLVGFLNLKLSVDADPVYSGKARDYPSNILPAEVRKAILGTLSSCPDATLQAFYQQFFMSISSDMNKGLHVEGTKIILQLLSVQKPDIVLSQLSRYAEHLRSIQSRVPACLASLWVLGQAAVKNPKIGVQIFMEAMLPLLNLKNYASFIMSVVTSIVPKTGSTGFGKDSINVQNFFKFYDLYHGIGENVLSPNIRQGIEDFFSTVSDAAVRNLGSQLFIPFFNRLAKEVKLQKELCRSLVEVLESSPDSAAAWANQYKNNLPTSAVLLNYIAENHPTLAQEVPELKSALLEMRDFNSNVSPGSKTASIIRECIPALEALLQHREKKKSSGSCIKMYNSLLFVALASVIYYDVTRNGNGNFSQSRLGQAAEKYGLVEQYNKAYAAAGPYVESAWEKAGPYVETARQKLGPVVDSAKVYAGVAYNYLYNKGEELRPGVWRELGERWEIYSEVGKDNALFAAETTKKFVQERSTVAWEKAEPYVQDAVRFTKTYLNEENALLVWKKVNQAYHRSMHALGLCNH